MSGDAVDVDFVKISATGNMTVLVTSAHPSADHPAIAAELMSVDHVHAEQVGFVLPPVSRGAQVRLRMAGDEFCGNACMAVAAMAAVRPPGCRVVVLDASGVDGPVTCEVTPAAQSHDCWLEMAAPGSIEPFAFPGAAGGAVVVRYRDAVHVVVETAVDDPATRGRAEEVAASLVATAGEVPSLVAVVLYDSRRSEMAALVRVPAVGSSMWERSCASGSASVGAYLTARSGSPVCASLTQPGGVLQVRGRPTAGGTAALQVGGRVSTVARGRAYVHV